MSTPTWLYVVVVIGRFSIAAFITGIVLVITPAGLAEQVPIVAAARKKLRTNLFKMWTLSFQGPFFRFIAYMGKKVGGKHLASACLAPVKLLAKPISADIVQFSFTPTLPFNPFHEETYRCEWRIISDPKNPGTWHGKDLMEEDYNTTDPNKGSEAAEKHKAANKKKDDYGRQRRYRVLIQALPAQETVEVRVCGVGGKGRGEFGYTEVTMDAVPSEENGLTGPLGGKKPKDAPAGVKVTEGQYTWWQSKHEVGIRIVAADNWLPKTIKVKTTKTHITIANHAAPTRAANDQAAMEELILSGDLGSVVKPCKVQLDDVFWEIDTNAELGRHLVVTLRKDSLMEKWPAFLQGKEHHCVDINQLKLHYDGNAMTELGCKDLWE